MTVYPASSTQGDIEALKQENTDNKGEIDGLQMRLKSSSEEIALLRIDLTKQRKVRIQLRFNITHFKEPLLFAILKMCYSEVY